MFFALKMPGYFIFRLAKNCDLLLHDNTYCFASERKNVLTLHSSHSDPNVELGPEFYYDLNFTDTVRDAPVLMPPKS